MNNVMRWSIVVVVGSMLASCGTQPDPAARLEAETATCSALRPGVEALYERYSDDAALDGTVAAYVAASSAIATRTRALEVDVERACRNWAERHETPEHKLRLVSRRHGGPLGICEVVREAAHGSTAPTGTLGCTPVEDRSADQICALRCGGADQSCAASCRALAWARSRCEGQAAGTPNLDEVEAIGARLHEHARLMDQARSTMLARTRQADPRASNCVSAALQANAAMVERLAFVLGTVRSLRSDGAPPPAVPNVARRP